MEEIWKAIPSYEGMYEVSSLGRVKSLSRIKTNTKGSYMTKEKILKVSSDGKGYLHVCLSNYNKKTYRIHQLVAMTFLNHKRDGHKLVVDHINNIQTDNRLENLQIISQRKNTIKNKTNKTSKYEGVDWHKASNKWRARIYINGKYEYLGIFSSEEEAYLKYKERLLNK